MFFECDTNTSDKKPIMKPVLWLPKVLWTLRSVRSLTGIWGDPVEHLPAPLTKDFVGGIVRGLVFEDGLMVATAEFSPTGAAQSRNGLVSIKMTVQLQSPIYVACNQLRNEIYLRLPDDAHGIAYELVTTISIVRSCVPKRISPFIFEGLGVEE